MDLTSTTSIGIYRMWECCGNNELAPLKLALVTRWYPPLIGGAEKVFYYLAGALAAEGANVTVVTSQKPGRALSAQEEVSVKPNRAAESVISTATGRLSVVRLETSRLRFWGTWRYMRNLAQWFEQNAVDLAYVSMLKHDAYVAVRAGKRMGFPVVLRPEGAGATGDVAWQSWGRFGRKIGLACRQADAIISISKAVEVELRQAAGIRNDAAGASRMRPRSPPSRHRESFQFPTGCRFRNCRGGSGLNGAGHRAVFVGRLASEKGLDTLIEAWLKVRARFPTAQLILVGEGPERAALENQARAIGLTLGHDQAVSIPGSVRDSTETLRQADLFVFPSREEGMSIALLEAMALGLPVVASSIPGNRRLIDDLEHGRLDSAGDPDKLAKAIIEQWENPDRAFQMGLAARHRVERNSRSTLSRSAPCAVSRARRVSLRMEHSPFGYLSC